MPPRRTTRRQPPRAFARNGKSIPKTAAMFFHHDGTVKRVKTVPEAFMAALTAPLHSERRMANTSALTILKSVRDEDPYGGVDFEVPAPFPADQLKRKFWFWPEGERRGYGWHGHQDRYEHFMDAVMASIAAHPNTSIPDYDYSTGREFTAYVPTWRVWCGPRGSITSGFYAEGHVRGWFDNADNGIAEGTVAEFFMRGIRSIPIVGTPIRYRSDEWL